MKNRFGFTMMEIIVVMIILGFLVVIAVPNFNSSINSAQVQEAKNSLLAIYAGQQTFRSRNDLFYTSNNGCAAGTVTQDANIGNAAGLNIPLNTTNINYCCGVATSSTFTCYAQKNEIGGFVMQVTNTGINLSTNPTYPDCTGAFNPCCVSAPGKTCP